MSQRGATKAQPSTGNEKLKRAKIIRIETDASILSKKISGRIQFMQALAKVVKAIPQQTPDLGSGQKLQLLFSFKEKKNV